MKRLVLCSVAVLTAGLLVGCEESPQQPHTGSTSYGYQAPPSAYSKPSRYSKLPDRSESAGQTASVRGFPPGHPLHKDDSYEDSMMQHQADENSLPEQQHPSDSTSLPHSNFNY